MEKKQENKQNMESQVYTYTDMHGEDHDVTIRKRVPFSMMARVYGFVYDAVCPEGIYTPFLEDVTRFVGMVMLYTDIPLADMDDGYVWDFVEELMNGSTLPDILAFAVDETQLEEYHLMVDRIYRQMQQMRPWDRLARKLDAVLDMVIEAAQEMVAGTDETENPETEK